MSKLKTLILDGKSIANLIDMKEAICAVAKGLITKKDIYAELGSIICGKKKGRANGGEITVFDSTGLAIQDLAVANMVYNSALKKNAGTKINLI